MPRTLLLWSLFALQSICCAYFLSDILWDIFWPGQMSPLIDNDTLELLVTFALFLGLGFTSLELRKVLTRQNQLEDQIKIASGAFNEVMEARFSSWSLTAAEREVAILAIKGFSIAEMADLRETKQGTIKAQCASVYKKAGVTGRLQLLSVFLDDLMADDLVKPAGTNFSFEAT
ncbi:MAG: hypothetical protein AAF330_00875 [Pseudomonadota bacterium]